MTTRIFGLAVLALCLIVAAIPARGQGCSTEAGDVASACSSFEGDLSSHSGLSSNSSYQSAIQSSGQKITSACCNAFSSFLSQSCRCNSDTEPLITGAGFNDQNFQQIIYAAAIACKDQLGITLSDPQFGETCNGGVVSGGK